MLARPEHDYQKLTDDWTYEKTRGHVQSGPFAGMRMLRETSWPETTLSPMLLGTFEQELSADIEAEIARLLKFDRMPKVVNVGCAEGYYAVGLACRLAPAPVVIIDINPASIERAKQNAELNAVKLISDLPVNEAFDGVDLIVMDCEGVEVDYLDLDDYPDLLRATIIVEVHNLVDHPRADVILEKRFRETHEIKEILEGGRDPNVFKIMANMPSAFRWMAICENRPCLMSWLVLRPK